MMQTRERPETTMERRTDRGGRTAGSSTSGRGEGVLGGLAVLACPLLCVGPLLLAGLASTGLIRALEGAPWLLIAGVVLVVLALGAWGTRARQTRRCCAPSVRPTPLREVSDESAG
ncbi:MAG: hypothetical protein LC769_06980 [Chloroflexi bacterium]|nr:hypothetical protein [Chloroflexota bacterium]